jgi:hypothetical protein
MYKSASKDFISSRKSKKRNGENGAVINIHSNKVLRNRNFSWVSSDSFPSKVGEFLSLQAKAPH